MKAEFLKIAGVKSEAEFYKKFPSEEAFVKKHGKALKKLKAKKANVGTMISNTRTPQSNLTPIRIDQEYMNDSVSRLTGGKSTKELKDEAMYNAQMASYQSEGEEGKKPGFMDSVMGFASQFSDMGGDTGGGTFGSTGGDGQKISDAMAGDLEVTGIVQKNGGTTKKFKAHMMYNPKTGKGKQVKTLKEHLILDKKGWGNNPPKAQDSIPPISPNQNFPDVGVQGEAYSSPGNQFLGIQEGAGGMEQAGNILNSSAVQDFGIPIVSDVIKIKDKIDAQKEALGSAKQRRQVSELALQASKTMPEKIEREYVRPEDFTNTGEEFFPVYGVGTNVLKHGGMYKAQDGGMFTGEYMPLVNPNQQKQFKPGGYLRKAQGGFTGFDAGSISYGGGMGGAAGTQLAGAVGVNNDAGSDIGGTIGSTIGSAFGPAGAAVGGFLGSAAGDLLDRNDRRQKVENDATARNTEEMAYNSVAPAIQAGFASHVKNGGKVPAYRSGGNMRGDYVSPNPSALDTMAMGGELKSLWGGELETVSYNPYAGGESVEPKNANSHSYRDPRTGQTGQGIAYGENSVNNNEASVEIEGGEPMQKLKQGGEEENLVVYGDMYIPDNLVPLIEDDRAKGKKFKSYVSNILNPQEAKINRRQEKVADLGLESDYTTIGQLERNTADLVLQGSDMKLKSIAEKKNMLAELQNTMNETFDQYGMDANKFIKKGEMVKDPMRIENSEMAKYGKRVPKAQTGITSDDFDKKQIPKTKMTEEELEENGYVQEGDSNIYVKTDGENVEAVEASGDSLGYTPEGQSANESGTYGNTTQKDVDAVKANNTWFKGDIDLSKDPVTFEGKFVNPDVLRFQQEFNERVKGTDTKPVKVDGKFGEETKTAMYTEPVEGKEAVQEKVILEQPETTTKSTTFTPQSGFPIPNFQRPIEDVPLGVNQTLAERYALATNQYIPVPAQGLQSDLSVPYDISLQAQKNDLISMSRTLDKNPALENNPAALALVKGQLSSQLNQINETEFIANQKMKSDVYSKNRDIINQTRLANLGIFDRQAERSVQAVANTRTQNIDALGSIADKELQNQRDNAMRKVYANMYPTFRFNNNYQTEVQQTGQSPFSVPGTNQGINPFGLMSNISGNNNLGQYMNYGNNLINLFTNKNKKKDEVEELEEIPAQGRYGKKVTKNNKNSNILREIRNL
jgi:hypothetical protein|tara:strand:+ start:4021 stop:7578 length:3558 start_codon:yes stop_codon:yes gene_type:complete